MRFFKKGRQLEFFDLAAISALGLEVGGLGLYALAIQSIVAFGILFLLGLAATGGGGILGFLFGVPRFRTDAHVSKTFLFNTNLEQVSDWLTKIIIGATLVQIDELAEAIGRVSLFIGREIDKDGSATAACSIILFSFVAGFMWAYLWMSLRVKDEFEKDSQALKLAGLGGQGG